MTKREILKKSIVNFRNFIRVANANLDTDFEFVLRIRRDLSAQIDLLVYLDIISVKKGFLLDEICSDMMLGLKKGV